MITEQELASKINEEMVATVRSTSDIGIDGLKSRLQELIPKSLRQLSEETIKTEGGRTIPIRQVKVEIQKFGSNILAELRMRGESIRWTIPVEKGNG